MPRFEITISLHESLIAGCIFTMVSLISASHAEPIKLEPIASINSGHIVSPPCLSSDARKMNYVRGFGLLASEFVGWHTQTNSIDLIKRSNQSPLGTSFYCLDDELGFITLEDQKVEKYHSVEKMESNTIILSEDIGRAYSWRFSDNGFWAISPSSFTYGSKQTLIKSILEESSPAAEGITNLINTLTGSESQYGFSGGAISNDGNLVYLTNYSKSILIDVENEKILWQNENDESVLPAVSHQRLMD